MKKLARTSAFLAFGSAPGAPGVAAVVRAARELAVVRVLVGSRAGLARGSLALEPAVLRGLLLVAVLVLAAEEDRGERGASRDDAVGRAGFGRAPEPPLASTGSARESKVRCFSRKVCSVSAMTSRVPVLCTVALISRMVDSHGSSDLIVEKDSLSTDTFVGLSQPASASKDELETNRGCIRYRQGGSGQPAE